MPRFLASREPIGVSGGREFVAPIFFSGLRREEGQKPK
jgi:hypothetical protein